MGTPSLLGLGDLGVGICVGAEHYAHVLAERPPVDWIEVVPEHAMESRGRVLGELEKLAEHYPVALHGMSMSIGSTDPLDCDYLDALAELGRRLDAAWVSDHLGWTSVAGLHCHTPLPLPYDEQTLAHVADRVRRAQDALGLRLLIENPAAHLGFVSSTMPEQEFLARLAETADCGLLVDLGSLQVSRASGAIDGAAASYLDALPAQRVGQVHLSAYVDLETHAVAAVDAPLADAVWEALDRLCARLGRRAVSIDRAGGNRSPSALLGEVAKARGILERASAAAEATDGF